MIKIIFFKSLIKTYCYVTDYRCSTCLKKDVILDKINYSPSFFAKVNVHFCYVIPAKEVVFWVIAIYDSNISTANLAEQLKLKFKII